MSRGWLAIALLGATASCPLRSVGPDDRYRCLGPGDCSQFGQTCCGDGFCAIGCPDAGPSCPLGVDAGIGCGCEGDPDAGVSQGDCLDGELCLPANYGYPGGVCSAPCEQGSPCPDGSQCLPADLTSGSCLASCADDADCARSGYSCAPGLALCIPTGASTGVDPGGRAGDGGACEPPFAPSPDAGLVSWSANLDVSEGSDSLAEVGPTIAANDAGVVAIGWSRVDESSPGIGLAVSQNGGGSFSVQTPVWDGVNSLQSDPTLAADATGRFTYVWTGFDEPADDPAGIVNAHIWAATAPDALHWSAAVDVDDRGDAGTGLDKPWLGINPITRAPWVVYRSIPDGVETIQLSIGASVDGGLSFAPSVQLDDGSRSSLGRNSTQLVFDASGTAYVAWIELGSAYPDRDSDDFDGSVLNTVRFTRLDSQDGGGTSAPLSPDVQLSAPGDAVVQNQPGLAVAADGSSLFAAYTVGINEATDIVVTASMDRGLTWSTPVKANDDAITCATHLHPWLQLDGKGRLWLLWFDNRDGLGHVAWSVSTERRPELPTEWPRERCALLLHDQPREPGLGRRLPAAHRLGIRAAGRVGRRAIAGRYGPAVRRPSAHPFLGRLASAVKPRATGRRSGRCSADRRLPPGSPSRRGRTGRPR